MISAHENCNTTVLTVKISRERAVYFLAKNTTRPVGTKLILGGGAETRSEQREQEWGFGGLPPGKFFMTTPLRSLENAPFLENVLLMEAKDHD